jgi:RimJ/RimL family protein N-acetyltransferase
MYLRDLEEKDAPLMLEWMHDDSVVDKLKGRFKEKTMDDCLSFIRASNNNRDKDIHLAICSDEDEYMGTVSLKNIDRTNQSAEFAITVRKCSMGKGYSWFGMKEIIVSAFEDYGLENIYWCVSRLNQRALRFYDKHNFSETADIPKSILDRYRGTDNLKWYSVTKWDGVTDGMMNLQTVRGGTK